jgi:hypothetical protein
MGAHIRTVGGCCPGGSGGEDFEHELKMPFAVLLIKVLSSNETTLSFVDSDVRDL